MSRTAPDSLILIAYVNADTQLSAADLQPGYAVGPYDVIAPIGIGGMAHVWVARVRGRSDLVAVKLLLPELAENDEFRKMFFDEAEIASRVRHPNVCLTYELGQYADTLYIAMEYIDGGTLMRVLRPGREDVTECARIPIRPRVAARIVADAAAGLHAAHELRDEGGRLRNVVHRDVSPHNLLITQAGEVKITDFGVVKALGKSHMTMAGQLKGKLAYMAPEQLTGGQVDRRTDVFALGCVLYEITVGARPFTGEHDPQVMASIMLGRMDLPSAAMPTYPSDLEAIVMKALANDPKDRFASAEEMRIALESFLAASGPPITPAQVAALVMDRCRNDIEVRAMQLGLPSPFAPLPGAPPIQVIGAPSPTSLTPTGNPGWGTPSSAGAFDSGSAAMSMERGSAPGRRGIVWFLAAAIVGASLGVGVLSYLRSVKKAKAVAAAQASASATAAALPSTAPAAVPATSASGIAVLSPLERRIRLKVVPATAVVVVDDVVLPPGTDSIKRPPDGTTLNVLVRAEKYQDTIVLVDAATPDEVDVTLEPATTPKPLVMMRADGGGLAPSSTSSDRKKGGGAGANGANGASGTSSATAPAGGETPPNPYE